ncbi:alpha/beta fold hydrolase [Pseudomonas gingeri]|uniref:alpha/beta fold hydrolase n=1 Tax=Pseudomonas gingeri TaxID=117681 RepID=UPI0015A4ED14|nr:alpha/beta hydrolase [Pseudomonas gingeri]NWD69492.1 alpha/beta fold hydrolase [Pseudomonas gingeri]
MKVVSNGIQLEVSDCGASSPALVFLHYWGGSSRTWDDVRAALPSHYRSIAHDHRGWGDSQGPTSGYALADFVDDTLAVIAALSLGSYVLIGHSMGGKIAQLFASRRPAGLIGLVLVAPSPPGPLRLPAEVQAAMETAYESRESVAMAIEHMLTAKPLSLKHHEQVIEDSLRGAPQAKAAWPCSTSREDITAEVAAIEVPTLVIAGERDRVDPVEVLRAEVLSRIPQATLHELAGTGHLSPLESADEVAGAIQRFVEGLGR